MNIEERKRETVITRTAASAFLASTRVFNQQGSRQAPQWEDG